MGARSVEAVNLRFTPAHSGLLAVESCALLAAVRTRRKPEVLTYGHWGDPYSGQPQGAIRTHEEERRGAGADLKLEAV